MPHIRLVGVIYIDINICTLRSPFEIKSKLKMPSETVASCRFPDTWGNHSLLQEIKMQLKLQVVDRKKRSAVQYTKKRCN
jgi:hypothetical protein